MNFYQYRWVVMGMICLILFMITYIYDVHPLFSELNELHQSESEMLDKLQNSKTIVAPVHCIHHKNKLQGFNTLLASLQSNGLRVMAMSELPLKQDGIAMRLMLEGSYQQWSAWTKVLVQQTDAMHLQHISCQSMPHDNLKIVMELVLNEVEWNQSVIHSSDGNEVSPFCDAESSWIIQHEENEMLSAPLALIKMTGYLQYDSHRSAIVILPNQSVSMVSEGDLLGGERGMVLAIHRNYMLVELQSKKLVKIMLMRN